MSTAASALTSVEGGLDTLWANTLGVVWRAASGTVDPWTKAIIQQDAAAGVTQALGTNPDPATVDATVQASTDGVTSFLTSVGADPSQVTDGITASIQKLNPLDPSSPFNPANWSTSTMLIVAGLIIAVLFAAGFLLRK